MYSDKVKVNERPNRLRLKHGDVIIRSEYNDGVLRNNNRANNRLSSQMQMFDKAQRVIMKDLGKETQFIKNKMNSTTAATPRQRKYSPLTHIGTFNMHKKSTYTINAKGSKEETPRETNSSLFHSLTDRSMYSVTTQSKRKTEGRTSRVRPIIAKSDNILRHDIDMNTPKIPLTERQMDSGMSVTSRTDRKVDSFLNSFTPSTEKKPNSVLSGSYRSSQQSATTINRKGGIHGPLADRQLSATSRLSFIEILQKAEEAKAKGLNIEEHVPRPKTPELLSDYGSDESEKEQRRKPSHIGATPKSTYISHHM